MNKGPLEPDKNPLFSAPENIPEIYWLRLKEDYYEITFLGKACKVIKEQKKIEIEKFPFSPNFQVYLVILAYLNSEKVALKDEWVLARELKGGIHFFDRSHPLTVDKLLEKVKEKRMMIKAFKTLKGRELDFGDFSYEVFVFPDVHLRYIYFEGDDEFPSELTVNFQKGIENILPLDVIWAMVNVVNRYLISAVET